ncbi:MAG: hypothetical protein K2M34_05055 [Alphaproteobacteria bacterium]|nr:hypothetical protein [Alphaproteobacteria bacterium]
MALKPRYKRRILWTLTSILGMTAVGVVIIPPMINLNALKPKLQSAIIQQTGVNAIIRGDINFSMLGRATIVAHDVETPLGQIRNVAFSVPLSAAFDLASASLTGNIAIHGGQMRIDTLETMPLKHDIEIYNTSVEFLGKQYTIVRGRLSAGELTGNIRTDQHKYEIHFADNEFYIHNQNDNLEIFGQLYSDGTARGRMAIDTNDINRWFQFSEPKINMRVRMTTNFDWDGEYGFKFSDIYANDTVHGDIELMPDGARNIKMSAQDLDFDFSFLANPSTLLQRTSFDLDFYGNLSFGKYNFNHLQIVANGTDEAVFIKKIIADDISITGGTIDKNGAHNMIIQMPYEGIRATCVFSGTPENWTCEQFTWGDIRGQISVKNNTFNLVVASPNQMPTNDVIARHTSRLAPRGTITFKFADMGGTINIDTKSTTPKYTFAKDKTMSWLNPNFKFLPNFMTDDIGDFSWRDNDTMDFTPHSGRWFLSLSGNRFYMTGTNIKDLFPHLDLQSIDDMGYTISGTYSNKNISDLKIEIGGHTFTGTYTGDAIRLNTTLLNLDTFINQGFIDNYDELQFLANAPIMIPFDLNTNVFISADRIIYNGAEYQNFTYSLKPGVQAFSITDNARGNMLAIIEKKKTEYDISLQLNKFVTNGALLSSKMPLNITDSTITADIELTTSGYIAHDLEYNLSGNIEMIFDGGYIMGLGLDGFYASAENITRLNAEYVLADALDGGKTRIKNAFVAGEYKNGDFITTKPITLQMRHADAVGGLGITSSMMTATFDITMRGTAPTPVTIQLDIAPDNSRGYSLSEIMQNFDASFMRAFVKTHNKF